MNRSTIMTVVTVVAALIGWILYAMESNRSEEQLDEVSTLSSKLSSLEESVATAEQAQSEAATALSESEARLAAAREYEATLDATVNDLTRELEAVRGDAANKASALLSVREDTAKSEANLQTLKEELVKAVSTEQNLRNELAGLSERSQRRLEALEADLAQSVKQLEEAKKANVALVAENTKLADKNAELTTSSESNQSLRQDYEELKAKLVSEQSQRSEISENLLSKREILDEASQALQTAISERDKVEADLEAAREKAEHTAELEQKLSEANARIAERTDNLTAERSRVDTLEADLADLNRRSEELVQQLQVRESEVTQLNEERDKARLELENLRNEIEQVVAAKDTEVREIRDRVTLIRMDSDIVFAFGSTRLREKGQAVLDSIAEYARNNEDRIISLEGHTDSVPISVDRRNIFPSNWELSAARAASAARYLESKGIPPERLRIVGYGEYRPVDDNKTPEGRSANRRLEIVLSPANRLESSASVQ
ncbi:MAG: flagellar motor protein [marine bacterium B5-7]|nr:MAG: flagellar motor protein [marine bacterium B5-7]